jgi:hypothetical protein
VGLFVPPLPSERGLGGEAEIKKTLRLFSILSYLSAPELLGEGMPYSLYTLDSRINKSTLNMVTPRILSPSI